MAKTLSKNYIVSQGLKFIGRLLILTSVLMGLIHGARLFKQHRFESKFGRVETSKLEEKCERVVKSVDGLKTSFWFTYRRTDGNIKVQESVPLKIFEKYSKDDLLSVFSLPGYVRLKEVHRLEARKFIYKKSRTISFLLIFGLMILWIEKKTRR